MSIKTITINKKAGFEYHLTDKYEILSYECQIGDAIAFNYATIHSAYGNNSNNRRRAFSIRFSKTCLIRL